MNQIRCGQQLSGKRLLTQRLPFWSNFVFFVFRNFSCSTCAFLSSIQTDKRRWPSTPSVSLFELSLSGLKFIRFNLFFFFPISLWKSDDLQPILVNLCSVSILFSQSGPKCNNHNLTMISFLPVLIKACRALALRISSI